MSYDIRILRGDDPYAEPTDVLDVRAIVNAVNAFPPFAERGVTWANQRWHELSAFEGMMIDLEGHDPERIGPGRFDEQGGTCDSVHFYVSYGSDSDLIACLKLAVRIAKAAGATAWDLQTEQSLDLADSDNALVEWNRIRERFAWLLRPRRSFWSTVRSWFRVPGDPGPS